MLLALMLSGCDEGPNVNEFNYEPEVNVFALLLLNSGQTIIRLEESCRAIDPLPENRGIADAEVTISAEDQRVAYVDQGGGLYQEAGEKLRLVPGMTYELAVNLKDGRRVEARCIMPAPPVIRRPADQEHVAAYESLPVSWEEAPGVQHYWVSVRGNMYSYNAEVKADSSAIDFYPFYLAQPDIYVLRVAAVDRNYHDYALTNSEEQPVWHITGGIGVFGALAFDERIIIAQ
jgi:hypothetical protein